MKICGLTNTLNLRMPPHPMMPMAALYGMPGHPYGPAMSMPGKNLLDFSCSVVKIFFFTTFSPISTPFRWLLGSPVGDIRSHDSPPSAFRGRDVGSRRFPRRSRAPRQPWRAWPGRWAGEPAPSSQPRCQLTSKCNFFQSPGGTKVFAREHGLPCPVPPPTPRPPHATPPSDGAWRECVITCLLLVSSQQRNC